MNLTEYQIPEKRETAHGSPPLLLSQMKFRLIQVPDIPRVISNGTVSAEYAGLGDVVQGHLVPDMGLTVQLLYLLLRFPVGIEVRQYHIGIVVYQGIEYLRELLAAKAVPHLIERLADNGVVLVNVLGVVPSGAAVGDLFCAHTKDDDVLVPDLLLDFHIGAVQGAQGDGAVEHQLHVARAGGLGARQGNLLGYIRGGHQQLGEGDAVILQIDNTQLVAENRVLLDFLGQGAEHTDNLLCHKVSGGRLGPEDEGPGDDIHIGVFSQGLVKAENMQAVEVLALDRKSVV